MIKSTFSASSFLSKVQKFKGIMCFHPNQIHKEIQPHEVDVDNVFEEQQHEQQQQKDEQEQQQVLVVYVKGDDTEESIIKKYDIPLTYISCSATFRGLLERSGEELESILLRGLVVIRCEIEVFERVINIAKGKAREDACMELSYDERLWSRLMMVGCNAAGERTNSLNLFGKEMRYSCASH